MTQTGIVIEVQHSQMTDAEHQSREAFYQNLVWIVDGRGFRSNFDIYHPLPHPSSELAQDIRYFKATRPIKGAARGLFWRLTENPDANGRAMVLTHTIHEISAELQRPGRRRLFGVGIEAQLASQMD